MEEFYRQAQSMMNKQENGQSIKQVGVMVEIVDGKREYIGREEKIAVGK